MRRLIALALAIALTSSLGCTKSDSDESGGGGNSLSTNACGLLGLNPKVINGTACTPESQSSVVEVVLDRRGGRSGVCSGEVLGPRHVLTAAHCFLESQTSVSVIAGGRRISAARVIQAPGFATAPDGALINDAAIIELAQAVSLRPLAILGSNRAKAGDVISVFGYGLDERGRISVLKSGQMRLSQVTNERLVAVWDGEDGSNVSNGDSGGPAMFTFTSGNTTVSAIAGITSTGTVQNCAKGDTTIFTNLSKPEVLNFITSVVPNVAVR